MRIHNLRPVLLSNLPSPPPNPSSYHLARPTKSSSPGDGVAFSPSVACLYRPYRRSFWSSASLTWRSEGGGFRTRATQCAKSSAGDCSSFVCRMDGGGWVEWMGWEVEVHHVPVRPSHNGTRAGVVVVLAVDRDRRLPCACGWGGRKHGVGHDDADAPPAMAFGERPFHTPQHTKQQPAHDQGAGSPLAGSLDEGRLAAPQLCQCCFCCLPRDPPPQPPPKDQTHPRSTRPSFLLRATGHGNTTHFPPASANIKMDNNNNSNTSRPN